MKASVNNLYLNDFVFAGTGIAYKSRLYAVKSANRCTAKAKAKSISRGLNSGKLWLTLFAKFRLLTLHKIETWRNISAVKLSFAEYAAIICK